MQEDNRKIATLEAVLFAMGESVNIQKLAEIIEEDEHTTEIFLETLQKRYEKEDSGIELLRMEDSFQLATKPSYYDAIIKIAKTPKQAVLTDSVLETLSIIAYKQPVTRLEIEKIRGVSCDHAINKLLEFDLIEELGRKDAPGRPLLFGTTENFLKSFGVSSLRELPEMDTIQIEEFKLQAEEEIQLSLNI